MSELLSVARRTVRGRGASSYEDLDGSEVSNPNPPQSPDRHTIRDGDEFPIQPMQELEMNSVSVVPDGKYNLYFLFLLSILLNTVLKFYI